MAVKHLTSLDLNRNEIINCVIQNLAAAPSSPVGGQIYVNTAGGVGNYVLQLYNGTSFVTLSSGAGSGTVTSVSVASANGFAGTVADPSSTPAITLTTTVTGLLKGSGTAISAATPGTDYLTPTGNGSGLTALNGTQVTTGTVAAARLPVLSAITAPTADLSLAGFKVTNLAAPTTGTDATTKAYVDATVQGLDPKPTATVATTAALPASTYANGTSGVGATLTGNANGALTVDGYAVAAADLVLVKSQAAGLQNGLYSVTQPGTAGTPFILTRNAEMDTTAEFTGAFVAVEDAGTANANSLWLCTNSINPTVGTTAITFSQLNSATQLSAGTGITIAGNVVSINTAYVGQTSITTLGTVATGTWQGTAVAVGYGGTGAATAAAARTNLGAVGKYSALIGDGSATSISVTQAVHGLASNGQLLTAVYDASTGAQVFTDITIANATGQVTFTFAVAPAANAYRVVIIG